MNANKLLEILNNRKEIPNPDNAEILFYFIASNGKEVTLNLKSVGAFAISTDITFEFELE